MVVQHKQAISLLSQQAGRWAEQMSPGAGRELCNVLQSGISQGAWIG